MFIINKNKILIVLIIIFVILLVLYFIKNNIKLKETIETVSLPVSGKTIVLDAGHGIPDERRRK